MGLGDVLDQGQADAGAADRLEPDRAGPVEALEDAVLLLRIDAGAPVAHAEHQPLALPAQGDLDLLAVGRVLDGVVDEVEHGQGVGVTVERHLGQVVGQGRGHHHVGLLQAVDRQLERAPHHLGHVGVGELVDVDAALDLGEVEHVVDQAGQAHALAPDDLGVLGGLARALGAALGQHLAEHADDRQRGLELVRDVGDELALELVGPSLAPHGGHQHGQAGDDHRQRHADEHEVDDPAPAAREDLGCVLLRHPQGPAVDRLRERVLDDDATADVAQRHAEHQLAELVDDLVQARRLLRLQAEELLEALADEVRQVVLEHDVVVAPGPAATAEREQEVAPVEAGVQVAALVVRPARQVQARHDLAREQLAEPHPLLAGPAGVPTRHHPLRGVEHEHADHRGSVGRDHRPEVGQRLELDRLEHLLIGVDQLGLDADDLLLGQLAHRVLDDRALPRRGHRGEAVAVVGQRHGCGQDRKNNDVYENQPAHGRGHGSAGGGRARPLGDGLQARPGRSDRGKSRLCVDL